MKYPFHVYKAEENNHSYWVAESCLKGCVAQGNTPEEAIQQLTENEDAWLETAEKLGFVIPDVPTGHQQEYSGKLTVRISSEEHRKAAINAKKEGVSLNQYISDAITARNCGTEAANYAMEAVTKYTVSAETVSANAAIRTNSET